MLAPQAHQHVSHVGLHRLRVMQGSPAAFFQPRLALLLIAFQPLITGLPTDFIAPAEFGQTFFLFFPFLDEASLLVQGLPLFPGQVIISSALVSEASPLSKSVSDVAGSKCQPCRPSGPDSSRDTPVTSFAARAEPL